MLNNLSTDQFKGVRPPATGQSTSNGGSSNATTVVTVKGSAPTITTKNG